MGSGGLETFGTRRCSFVTPPLAKLACHTDLLPPTVGRNLLGAVRFLEVDIVHRGGTFIGIKGNSER